LKFLNLEHAKALADEFRKEIERRHSKGVSFDDSSFPKQSAFIKDDNTLQAVQCSRRAGKSFGIAKKQLKECLRFPGSAQLYIGLTLGTARNIMWNPILKKINADLNLGARFNEARLEVLFPNGSEVKLGGADADAAQMEKFLGGSYRSCVIDEAGSFRQDLTQMVYEMLLPAVADWDGWIALTGTPTEITRGLFYDVSNNPPDGWTLHKWNTYENPYMKDKWAKQVEMLKKTNPRIEETPAFRRMYLNEWVIDHDSLCYKYDYRRNDIEELPHKDPLTYVLGVDLGFNDASAFTVMGYGEYDPSCYVVDTYKRSGMIISEVADRIKHIMKKYDPVAIVIDNASKQAVEELKQKFTIPLIAAEKQGKAEFIEIMNSDFILGNIKLLPNTEALKDEYGGLIWDKDKLPKRLEHPSCENHLADSTLYAFRYCYQYRHEKRPEVPTEEDKIDAWFDEQAELMEEDDNKEWWEK